MVLTENMIMRKTTFCHIGFKFNHVAHENVASVEIIPRDVFVLASVKRSLVGARRCECPNKRALQTLITKVIIGHATG